MLLLTRFYSLIQEYGDERTKDLWLMDRPLTILGICLGYVVLVKYIGPKFMEGRKPFELNRLMMVYNFAQVFFNTWLFSEFLINGWLNDYSFRCQPNNPEKTGKSLRMALGCYFFFLSKFSDFIDTFFFILRKKNSHISALHVIHHATTPISGECRLLFFYEKTRLTSSFKGWIGSMFGPVGHGTLIVLLNSFIHIVMYLYYAITAMGWTKISKMMKKSLTTSQIIQFVIVVTHSFQLLFIDCDYRKWVYNSFRKLFLLLQYNFFSGGWPITAVFML
jgi:elongation of very long chain fatty acids protein 7